jgi:transposase
LQKYNSIFFRMSSSRPYTSVPPATQRAIARDCKPGVRGHGAKSIGQQYGVPWQTVQHIMERAQQHGGDPVQPRGHKKRKLSDRDMRKLHSALDRNPILSNRQLAAKVGNKIAPRTVSDYLARADPPFTKHVLQRVEPEEKTAEWKAKVVQFADQVRRVPFRKRVYADESPLYANEVVTFGRARKGKRAKFVTHFRSKKYTLHVYVRETEVVHWELRSESSTDAVIEEVALEAVQNMKEGEVLIWDRFGRSGKKSKPNKLHYNPAVLAAIKQRGGNVRFLPPKGKYFNPTELLLNDLKSHDIRPQKSVSGENFTFEKLQSIIDKYMRERAPRVLPAFFAKCANVHEIP